ncbi:TAXI family TRAP transporter solute-binding subunit [Chloroflexota bacterium]
MNRRRLWLSCLLSVLLVALMAIGCTTTKEVEVEKEVIKEVEVPVEVIKEVEVEGLPNRIAIAVMGIGSTSYLEMFALMRAVTEVTGLKASVEPYESEATRYKLVELGDVELLRGDTTGTRSAALGTMDFEEAGPKPFRIIWCGSGSPWAIFTTKDSGIESWADVPGKRVIRTPTYAAYDIRIQNVLKAHGITEDDVVNVEFAGAVEAITGVAAGDADIALAGFQSTGLISMIEAQAGGVVWLPFEDEAIDEYYEIDSEASVVKINEGYTRTVDRDMYVGGTGYGIVCYETLDDEVAYLVTKGLGEGYGYYEDVEEAKMWTLDIATDNSFRLPFHPGAIRYYDEKGVWTEELEASQEQWLAAEEERIGSQ